MACSENNECVTGTECDSKAKQCLYKVGQTCRDNDGSNQGSQEKLCIEGSICASDNMCSMYTV